MRRAPVVPVAAALMAGILAGRYGPLGEAAWAAWAAAALLGAVVCMVWRRHAAAAVAVAAAVFALGALRVRVAFFRLRDDDVATWVGRGRTLMTLRGRVVGSASVFRAGPSAPYPRPPTVRFALAAEAVRVGAAWRPVTGRVDVTVEGDAVVPRRGMRLELVGTARRVARPANPGEPDFAEQARRRGQVVAFAVPAPQGVTVLAGESGGAVRRLLDRAANGARAHLAGSVPGRAGLLLEALLTGRRDPALGPLRETMARAGIAHLLSISGMHLGMFLGFVYLLCRLAMLGPRRSAAVALLCLGGYLLVAEPRSPLLRSAVMAAALCAGAILHRRHMALNALAVAAAALLTWDPMELFAPGFQLSFAIVAGLIVLTPHLRSVLFGRWLRERGLMVFRRDERVRRWLYHTAADWAINAVTMSLLAWLLAAPLVAHHFGLFSPYGAPLTLLAAPLVVGAIAPGYVSLALAGAAPNLSWALARAAGAAAEALAGAVELFRRLPGLCVELRPVAAWVVLAAYGCLVLFLLSRRWRWRRLAAVAAGVVLAAAAAWSQRPAAAPEVAELDFLAVGGGQCAVLRTPGGATWLLDAGSLGRADCGERLLVPFLRHRRLPMPEGALVSHANADHYNALPAVLRRGGLRRLYVGASFPAGGAKDGDGPAGALPARARRRGAQVLRLHAGHTVRLDGRTTVEVLWPPAGRAGLSVNESSLVLRVRCDDRSVLLPGDIEQVGQAALAALGPAVRADVLVLPHHGSWEPTLPALVEAVRPEVVVVSTARPLAAPLRGGQEAERFFDGLSRGRGVYTTRRDGCISVRFGHGRVDVRTMFPRPDR